MSNIIERLQTEADLCRNDGAEDIARLLDDAVSFISEGRNHMRNPPRPLLDRLRDRAKSWAVCSDDRGLAASDITEAIGQIEYLTSCVSDDSGRALDAAIRLADMSVQEIKLMAGEMTAGELRAVRAVVKGIVARITALREATK